MILAIDTSVGISVAIHDGQKTLAQRTTSEHGQQGEHTADYLNELLTSTNCAPSDIKQVVVGVGPGPFTGLRVGIATAVTFAHALQIPVRGLCSLDAVGFVTSGECIVISDARRKELYWAKYLDGKRVSDPTVSTPQVLRLDFPGTHFVGPAANLYPELISGEFLELRAEHLAELLAKNLGQFQDVVPMYLRKPDAVEPTNRKQVLQ